MESRGPMLFGSFSAPTHKSKLGVPHSYFRWQLRLCPSWDKPSPPLYLTCAVHYYLPSHEVRCHSQILYCKISIIKEQTTQILLILSSQTVKRKENISNSYETFPPSFALPALTWGPSVRYWIRILKINRQGCLYWEKWRKFQYCCHKMKRYN